MAQLHGIRGPIVSRQADSPTHLVSVMLTLTPEERAKVEDPAFAPGGDLGAAFTTVDFLPRNVRHSGGEMIIDYVYTGNTAATDIAELCRLAVETRLKAVD